MTEELNAQLLEFFKALADANRLKIVGLLAQQPHTVEELAALLGLGASTTSHHLARLAQAGLVSARAEGHYYFYHLQTDALQSMAQKILSQETLPGLSQDVNMDAFERKVREAFLNPDGSIKTFPTQEKKLLVILRHALNAFEPNQRYTEKQVNEILARFNEDTAYIRRSFIEYRLMEREGGGGMYWRTQITP